MDDAIIWDSIQGFQCRSFHLTMCFVFLSTFKLFNPFFPKYVAVVGICVFSCMKTHDSIKVHWRQTLDPNFMNMIAI